VTNFVAVNATTVTATLRMAPGTALGGHGITVTTPSGTTNAVPFTVTAATLTYTLPVLTTAIANTATKNGTLTVRNTGATAVTLTANPSITKTAGAGTFSITIGGSCVSGHVVNPGLTCTVLVQYVPSGTANSTAYVSLPLTGTGFVDATANSPNFNGN
jgi:hypothetical protein